MKQSEENEKSKYDKMMEEFPILYQQKSLSMTETCMCWGIECGEGWYFPLRDLSNKLESLNETFGKIYGFEIQAAQVKSKYGILHFYWEIHLTNKNTTNLSYFNDIVEKLIKEAEEECFNTCEKCGRFIGSRHSPRCETQGWISYLCEDCAKKSNSSYTYCKE